ncbi:hypothetical protein Nepgr_023209 [Nepenthes gracilis]|uniref:Uncharacterized protein n=1 Tax=Nepenthes gracilis TaxID=150966 RepID=A0AAD3T255_NEPGR|nr:hypothetical protein Nepgr_023209 [Nepenthes gracilis]
MLQVGIDPIDSRLPSICGTPVPISNEDRVAALGSSTCSAVEDGSQEDGFAPSLHTASVISEAANVLESAFPVCAVAAMDVVPSRLPTEALFEVDLAVVSAHILHDTRYGRHDMASALEDNLDLTPNSIIRLSSKYSLDASINVGNDTISPGGSLADVCVGQALDASKVKFYCAIGVIAMQYPGNQAKSRRQRKSASKNSKGSPALRN